MQLITKVQYIQNEQPEQGKNNRKRKPFHSPDYKKKKTTTTNNKNPKTKSSWLGNVRDKRYALSQSAFILNS